MKRRRHLSKEERDLWNLVAERTKPLDKRKPLLDPAAEEKPAAPVFVPNSMPPPIPLPQFKVGSKSKTSTKHDLMPSVRDSLKAAPVQMDHKAFGKLKRGKLVPEGKLDLHGLTLSEAHPELVAFILNAQADQKRLVLVITGKGKDRDDGGPIPTRFGVLRHQVPQWLRLPPLGQAVLQVTPAHLRHGGDGAYYVYLKRTR